MNIYDFTVKKADGTEQALSDFAGKVLLIVNVASKCGHTPQYKDLEALYEKYQDQGLLILGFPCNQFMKQEPGTDAEIQQFCQLNYGVTFPVLSKIKVNGKDADPLYKYLTDDANGFGGKVAWNFEKFLINRKGEIVKRIPHRTNPLEIIPDIEAQL